VVGDPLYRPFGRAPQQQHAALEAQKNQLVEWSHLRVVNLNLAMNVQPAELIDYLRSTPATRGSAVLLEKLADLCFSAARFEDAIETYSQALAAEPTEPQRRRLMLAHARVLALYQRKEEALRVYQDFSKRYPDYGDRLTLVRRRLSLAQDLNRKDDVALLEKEIEALSPPPPAPRP
jgi:tetratricopeptide (TPR) repeat protein